jgi:outer membrane protein OmpA-like peptidoglycan-associated protein
MFDQSDKANVPPAKRPGKPVDPSLRRAVEHATKRPVPEARVHSDTEAAKSASAIHARAFSYGDQIFLGAGDQSSEQHLVAHELAHVGQQTPGKPTLQRRAEGDLEPTAAEQHAEAAADAAVPERASQNGVGSIVEDGAPAGPGQLTRSAFLEKLRQATTAAAADVLGPLWPGACPYLENWFARHATDDAARLERLTQRYTGLGSDAGPERYVVVASQRLRQAIIQWSRGEATISALVVAAEPGAEDAVTIQAFSNEPARPAPTLPQRDVTGLGDGQPLDGAVAGRLGAFFAPLPDVRIHTDPGADRLARQAGASAFTFGSHVAFSRGNYQPGTAGGDFLIAHELAHVAQQRGGAPQRGNHSGLEHEKEANQAAIAVTRALAGQAGAKPAISRFAPLEIQSCKSRSAEPRSVQEKTPPAARADQKTLTNGLMSWNLRPAGSSSAKMDVYFFPNPALRARAKAVTFIQTLISTEDGKLVFNEGASGDFGGGKKYAEPSAGARVDFTLTPGQMPEDFNPFYGASWDDSAGHWEGAEGLGFPWQRNPATNAPAPAGSSGSAPSPSVTPASTTGTEAAHLFDNPQFNIAQGQEKKFETVAVVPETGEVLGSLRWSFAYTRENGRQFTGATQADCADVASPVFQGALARFYENRYLTINNFDPNQPALKPEHNPQLDAFIAAQRSGSAAIQVQGFADLSEAEPLGISRRRAETVQNYLVTHGIPADRITTQAFGADWARVQTAPGRSEPGNRRVQIAVSGK